MGRGEKISYIASSRSFFAFVDLKSGSDQKHDVFIVPSKVIFDSFNNPYFKSGKPKRWRWHPKVNDIEQFKNNWDMLDSFLIEKGEKH